MNEHDDGRRREALAGLREIRDALGADDAPRRVNLRDYAEAGSPAWEAFVEASGVPGHKVRRPTMLARINQAIDALTARLLGSEPPEPANAATAAPIATAHELDRLTEETPGQPRPVERQRLRRLTPDGIDLARAFLDRLRANPEGSREPPLDLLYDERYAVRFVGDIEIERRPFRTRRDAAEYLAPLLEPIGRLLVDHVGVWSWLGIFYFAETARVIDGAFDHRQPDERFVPDRHIDGRHYLWASWRLHEQHGDVASFLLDQEFSDLRNIAMRTLTTPRIFNSVGVVGLILRLYTSGSHQKRGFRDGPGGLGHLLRVLGQLERTYDVYGMEPNAILRILPDEFHAWDGGQGPAR